MKYYVGLLGAGPSTYMICQRKKRKHWRIEQRYTIEHCRVWRTHTHTHTCLQSIGCGLTAARPISFEYSWFFLWLFRRRIRCISSKIHRLAMIRWRSAGAAGFAAVSAAETPDAWHLHRGWYVAPGAFLERMPSEVGHLYVWAIWFGHEHLEVQPELKRINRHITKSQRSEPSIAWNWLSHCPHYRTSG